MRLASLPMYDWPEVEAETDAFWRELRDEALALAPGLELPERRCVPAWGTMESHWRDPGVVFSQTCWGPLSLGLIEAVDVMAQPDYSRFQGGRGPMYRSALIARDGVAMAVPDHPGATDLRAAIQGRRIGLNGLESLSGHLCLVQDLERDDIAEGALITGSHRASVKAVADGRADVAAIDCRSWALALAHEPCARDLVVVGWTSERWGLPYITSRETDESTKQALRKALINRGCHGAPERRNA